MVIFHTSDWHLGRMLRGRSLIEDQKYFLDQVFLPAVEQERPACVLLAGDIYDRQVASPEAIRLFDSALDRLTQLGCKVLAIAGNHDGADRIALMKRALQKSGVYLATQLEDALEPVLLQEGRTTVQVFLLPYFDPAQARDFFGDDSLRGEGQCMERMLEELKKRFLPGAKHILAAHCFAAGASVCDSESIFVGGSGQVPPSLFMAFDYVALGHLHGPQQAGENAWYSGSPLKYSVSEAGQKKGFLRLTGCKKASGALCRPGGSRAKGPLRRLPGYLPRGPGPGAYGGGTAAALLPQPAGGSQPVGCADPGKPTLRQAKGAEP